MCMCERILHFKNLAQDINPNYLKTSAGGGLGKAGWMPEGHGFFSGRREVKTGRGLGSQAPHWAVC